MKLICTMLLASLFATCECEAADQQAKILSFHLGDISANPPYVSIEKMNRVTWARMQDGSLKADGYATVTGGENPKKKISYWLSGDKRNLKICYHLTPYTHDELYPPDHPDWAPAAAAWIVPVEIRISGLKFAPKKALISDRCK